MPPHDQGHHGHRKIAAADADGGPGGAFRQVLVKVQEGLGRGRRAPGGPQDELEVQGIVQLSLVAHPQRRDEHAQVEYLDFGLDAGLPHHSGRLVEEGRVVDEDAPAQIDRAGVEGGQLRPKGERAEALRDGQVPPGDAAGGEAQDQVGFRPKGFRHLPEAVEVLAAQAGFRVPDMNVHDRRAGPPGLDGGLNDLFRGDRDVGRRVAQHAAARDGGGDDDLVHALLPFPCGKWRQPAGSPLTSATASSRMATISSTWPSVMMKGGASRLWSPRMPSAPPPPG